MHFIWRESSQYDRSYDFSKIVFFSFHEWNNYCKRHIRTSFDRAHRMRVGKNRNNQLVFSSPLIVDERFSWADQINEICWKLSQVAGVLFKARYLLNKEALMLIYHGLVGSKLRYGLICWATASKFLLDKVNVVHNKIVRCITFSKSCSPAWPSYTSLDVLPLDILTKIEWGKTLYKFQQGLLPDVFNNYFNRPRHQYSTRFANQLNFEVVRINLACEKSLLKYIGPKIWSNIPLSIKESRSVKVFVNKFREYLLENFDPP